MARSSTTARALSSFRQLCCLGLDPEAVMPTLLHELHSIIPSFANSFYFTNEAGLWTHFYFENTDTLPLLSMYLQSFYDRTPERRYRGLSFSDAVRAQYGPHTFEMSVEVDSTTYRRTENYNAVDRVLGYDNNFLRLVLRQGKRVLGGLRLWRSLGSGTWTAEEMRLLTSLEPFLVHALTVRDAGETPLVETDEIGLIIASSEGRPIYFSTAAKRLLFLATDPRIGPGVKFHSGDVLPVHLVRLCRNLGRIFSENLSAAAPMHDYRNAWGRFSFRAQWLEGIDAASRLVAITITHQEPLPIKLVRIAQSLQLTRRQAQVCVLLANGLSLDKIAERLGVARHTANEHSRWIYNKLEVHNRAELVAKLLLPDA